MILITGDTHALQERWVKEIEPYINKGDYLIVAGDFGFGFWDGPYWSENMFFDHIAEQEYTILFVDGNHEHFDKLYSYEESIWNGGKVHFIRHNLIHLCRGEYYQIEDVSLFVMGGGFSLDYARRTPGKTWFSQEMPCEEEYSRAEANLLSHGNKVDYIVTHTCPTESVYYMATLGGYGILKDVIEERPLTDFLQRIMNCVDYKMHYFGHFHIDQKIWRGEIALLNVIRELKTGDIVHKFEWYL